jgi:signal transduction histidine kinase
VPEEVQHGLRRYVYEEVPLFGYLYVTAPTVSGGVAVAAFLLKTDLPPRLGANVGDFASSFRAEVGEGIRILPQAPPWSQGVWDLELPDRKLLSVVLQQPDPEVRRGEVVDLWRGLIGILMVLAWAFLAAGGPPRIAAGAVASGGLVFLASTLPFSLVGRLESLFVAGSYEPFGLPGLGVGRFAALVMAGVTIIAILPRPHFRIPHWTSGAIAGVLFPLLLAWLGSGVAPATLAEDNLAWIVYQGSLATLLTLLTGSLLVFTASRAASPWLGVAATVAAGALGWVAAAFVWTSVSPPVWWPALMALPVALAARSLGAWSGWQRPVARWALSVVIAGAATIPVAWGNRVEARMAVGAERLDQLQAEDDPELEDVLMNLARVAASMDGAGSDEAEFLYGAWRTSGLADLGSPAWLTLWSASGIPGEELDVGVGARPMVAGDHLDEPEGDQSVRLIRYNRDDARYVLRVPLSGGRVLTVVAPPFGDLTLSSPLRALLAGGATLEDTPLTLIPLISGDERESVTLRWAATEDGWQGELPLAYQNAIYHAHYAVNLPTAILAAARGTLLLLCNLVLFLLFWTVGRALIHEALPVEARWAGFAVSFRSRVTLALFGFFLLANALFGTLAYRTLDGASHRAARVLAERVVEDAASFYLEVSGSMDLLAGRVGSELLEYRDGELREGSVEELVELGLYEGWIPFEILKRLDGREGLREFTETSLGKWEYVTAFRRLPDGDILASQVPLQAGATAIRTRDLVELLGFAVVLGGLLSLGLAFLVGRALTQPIHALQVASERVGAGDLDLRLPEERNDEFGSVFRAFNRMVTRIRRARRQQIRATRRTQAIMEEAAVGMVALDPEARVTLVNPRAEAVLEAPVPVGEPLAVSGDLGSALSRWLSTYLAGDEEEGGVELHEGERRIRVRARRLGQRPAPGGGVVIALEDVTDELRTERVLAWGEMARQVAHEVKNPLTPIKLSVQHLRRAWDDRPSDFDSILKRNADAILREIDRLAAIAHSFSRFGAPSDTAEGPLAPVVLSEVIGEVMDLYGASDGPIVFEADVPDTLPAVTARPAQVKEVLVNLLENARAGVGEEQGTVVVEARQAEGGGVDLHVLDDGAGIPRDLLPRVLEPHLSTRAAGTGLGLAIVQRLVESWGGTVSLESQEGSGTRVKVHLVSWRS